jgi:hypothetical protein
VSQVLPSSLGKPIARDVGFHGLRHTTATLLLKARVPYSFVQRIMRHSDPRLTTETCGHLELEDLRGALDTLAAGTAPVLDAESFGTHLVPADENGVVRPEDLTANASAQLRKNSGPSWIRTKDQSVMSRQL